MPLNLDVPGGVQSQYVQHWEWLPEVVFEKRCKLGQVTREEVGTGAGTHFLWLIFYRVRGRDPPDFSLYEKGVVKIREDARELGVTEIATIRPPRQACTKTWGKAGKWLSKMFQEADIHVRLYTEERVLF